MLQYTRSARLLASAALLALLAGCGPKPDSSFGAIAACEAKLQEQLVSPASYKLVTANFSFQDPLTGDEEDRLLAEQCEQDGEFSTACARLDGERFAQAYAKGEVRKSGGKPKTDQKTTRVTEADRTGFVLLEHDSTNSFGAVVRSFGVCRLRGIGADRKFEREDVMFASPLPREEGEAAKASFARVRSGG